MMVLLWRATKVFWKMKQDKTSASLRTPWSICWRAGRFMSHSQRPLEAENLLISPKPFAKLQLDWKGIPNDAKFVSQGNFGWIQGMQRKITISGGITTLDQDYLDSNDNQWKICKNILIDNLGWVYLMTTLSYTDSDLKNMCVNKKLPDWQVG